MSVDALRVLEGGMAEGPWEHKEGNDTDLIVYRNGQHLAIFGADRRADTIVKMRNLFPLLIEVAAAAEAVRAVRAVPERNTVEHTVEMQSWLDHALAELAKAVQES